MLTVVPRALGPRLGKDVQQVIKAVKARRLVASVDDGRWPPVVTLAEGEYELRLVPPDAGALGRRCRATLAWSCWTPR